MPSTASAPIAISSSSHLNRLLSTYSYVIADFHADWCGPCKAIAPVYESLAAQHSKPGKLAFVKVDVDAHQDIARKYEVTAMPTFLVLKRDSITNSLRGADPNALRRMVTEAAAAAEKSVSQSFSSAGNVLGSSSSSSSQSPSTADDSGVRKRNTTSSAATATASGTGAGMGGRRAGGRAGAGGAGSWDIFGVGELFASLDPRLRAGGDSWYITLIRFVILYLTTLLSLDPVASGMASPYRKNNPVRRAG